VRRIKKYPPAEKTAPTVNVLDAPYISKNGPMKINVTYYVIRIVNTSAVFPIELIISSLNV
jgi:hypothetical protein